jgi:hypothetical protein
MSDLENINRGFKNCGKFLTIETDNIFNIMNANFYG